MNLEVLRAVRGAISGAVEPHVVFREAAIALAAARSLTLVCLVQCERGRAIRVATEGLAKRATEAQNVLERGLPECVSSVVQGGANVVHLVGHEPCPHCITSSAATPDEVVLTVPLVWNGTRRGALAVTLPFLDAANVDEVALFEDVAEEIARRLLDVERIAALEDAEKRLRTLSERDGDRAVLTKAFDSAANGIVITDATGIIQQVNPALCKMSGYEQNELIGRKVSVFGSKTHDASFYRDLWVTILSGNVWHGEVLNQRKDGSTYEEDMTITPVREASGHTSHFIAIKQDVSARVRAASVIRESEERFRRALGGLPIGIAIARLDGTIVYLNDAFTRTFGYTIADVPTVYGLSAAMFPDLRVRDRMMGEFGRTAGVDEVRPIITERVMNKDGTVTMVELAGHRVGNEIVGTFVDLTERTRAASALVASEERYRNLVDNLDSIIFSADVRGTFTFINAAVRHFGYAPEEVVGRPAADFFHADDHQRLAELIEESATGKAHHGVELRLIDKAGRTRFIRGSARPIEVDGAVVGITGIADDITTQRETEEQLRAAMRMEAIGRLAGGVAHDFNNLLSVILSYTEIVMLDLPEKSPIRADLEEVTAAARRAEGLTRQLLAFSRKQVLVTESVDLNALTTGLSKMLERLIGEDIRLEIDTKAEHATTRGDRGQLEQVLMNLVVNARDALPRGGHLQITTRDVTLDASAATLLAVEPGEYVEVVVRDDGSGMTEDTKAHMFEPFFTTKELGKGTGLGLSTVYGIVRQSGGGIAVESALDQGTTFRIYFRLDRTAGASLPPRHVDPVRGDGQEKVLVVEDEPALRAAVSRVLRSAGYEVTEAANAIDALCVFSERGRVIDMVLTDVVMPGMSGRELADRMRRIRPALPVLFMSGYTDETLAQHGMLEQYLRKPFNRDLLTRRVRAVLDASVPRRHLQDGVLPERSASR